MTLKRYQKKRDFKKTPEPKGISQEEKDQKKIFVVQKHQARNLHYDLRLEDQGLLKSWAIPKQPPLKSGIKRLAMRVEDHPLEYGSFSGVIPEGRYGAGKVEIWDRGELEYQKNEQDEIIIDLKGQKLKGRYILVHPAKFKKDQWLFFKTKR